MTERKKPMLARALPDGHTIENYTGGLWVLEEKHDGHRLIIEVQADETIHAYSRNGKTRSLPDHVLQSLTILPHGIYDGELIVPGGTSTDVTAHEFTDELQFIIFDILELNGDNCTHMIGAARRVLLQDACFSLTEHHAVAITPQFDVSLEALEEIWNRGGEGAIIKRIDQVYLEGKRPKGWVKFKQQAAAELTITGFQPGLNGPHSIILLRDDDGNEISVKTRDIHWLKMFAADAASYIGRRLTISYQQRTVDGKYRHPMADYIIERK